jgi:hypothetical protein
MEMPFEKGYLERERCTAQGATWHTVYVYKVQIHLNVVRDVFINLAKGIGICVSLALANVGLSDSYTTSTP